MNRTAIFLRCAVALILLLGGKTFAVDLLPPGFRPLPVGVHALVGGKVVVKPGEVIDGGTIVIRDGLIQAVGKDVAAPEDARIWDMKGMTIYAGFIDPYLTLAATNAPISTSDTQPISRAGRLTSGINFFGAPGEKTDRGNSGPGYEVSKITPEVRAVETYSPNAKTLESLRELGFTAGVVAPTKGILRGSSALVALADENPNQAVIKPDVFQHIGFETHESDERAYPGSLMGVIATIRQTFFDAQHYALDAADFKRNSKGRKRLEFNTALEALQPVVEKKIPVLFEPGSALMVDRARRVADELKLDFLIVSCGQEWRRPDLAKGSARAPRAVSGASPETPSGDDAADEASAAARGARALPMRFIVPVNFPSLPKLPGDDDWVQVKLDNLRAWDWAAENPALLRQQGLDIALTTHGLSDKKVFRKNLRLALDRGLSENDALAALTTVPAKFCGVENILGTIEPGKLANLVVVDGNYFEPESKVREVWIDGRNSRVQVEETKEKDPNTQIPKTENPEEGAPRKTNAPPGKATTPVVAEQKPGEPENKVAVKDKAKAEKEKKSAELKELQKKRVARSPLEGRGVITNPPAILIRDATIWTCGPEGTLTNASVVILNGKIKTIGKLSGAFQESQTLTIDGHGLHITPGLIDCHSHTAILGAVNESTLPSTAMCRIGDVVNSETENFYQQLAGGLTVANLLHGSANPIGGQNQVIKLRDGAPPEELKFEGAMPGIKFALGENVKQSNWGEKNTTRFPQTRMGVKTFHQNRFTAAQEYLAEWEEYRRTSKVGQASRLPGERESASIKEKDSTTSSSRAGETPALLPPRRDLELETIGEIIQGKRLIHCHSYRQDEILAFIRTMESFGVRIGTLQHILEGYKVADEIAKHGAGASAFSDWWAFKFEVYDAIPYAGSLMRDRGVLVSFNSDSSELARRMNLEAAKAVKYGGTPEEEALKFVTLNPAKQLRIDNRVGLLEPGKDADFVIWSGHPLDSRSVCLQTWIDGKKYFDRSLSEQRAAALKKEREDLIAKAKKLSKLASGGDGGEEKDDGSFWIVALEREFDGMERHCMDEEDGE